MERIAELVDLPRLATRVVEFLPRLAAGVVILVLFLVLFRVTRPALTGVLRRAGLHEKLVELLVQNIYRYAVLIVGLVMAVDQLGVNVGAALAGIGIAGIALGFAAQDSVANVISGILIFWDKPFGVGDWIETEGRYGCVSNITLRTTRIRTPRNTYIVIPNKRIIDEVLENFSKHGDLRVDVAVGIAYKEDVRRARAVLLDAVASIDGVETTRPPEVVVDELGGSSVDLSVRVWISDAQDRQKTMVGVLELCKLALDEAGIQIPFPHLQLYLDSIEDSVWNRAATLVAGGRDRRGD